MLSRVPFLDTTFYRYHTPDGSISACTDYKTGDYCQGALAVKVDGGAANALWFINTHLGLADAKHAVPTDEVH